MNIEQYLFSLDPLIIGLTDPIKTVFLSKIEKGFMNHNYIAKINGKKFLVRISNFEDGFYGNKLDFEYHTLGALSPYKVAPKVYWYDSTFEKGLLIEEFIEGKQSYIFDKDINTMVAETIKRLQNIPLELTHMTREDPLTRYSQKYQHWMQSSTNKELIDLYATIHILMKNPPKYQDAPWVLCHNDLRLDNIIVANNTAYLIDLEGMSYGSTVIDIAGYYAGNVFFKKFGEKYTFSESDLQDWIDLFPIDRTTVRFFVCLQFFSDLCWLDNYIAAHADRYDLIELFRENIQVCATLLNFYEI